MRTLIFIILLGLVSCGPSKEEVDAWERARADSAQAAQSLVEVEAVPEQTVASSKQYCDNSHFTIGIYQVNGCEYICFVPADRPQGGAVCVVHAGNCNNPIHKEVIKEEKSILEQIEEKIK